MDADKISKMKEPKGLRNLMVNARRLDREDIHDLAFRQLVSLEGMDMTDRLERDFYSVLNAYEEILTDKNGRTTKASRTRQKLAKKGVRACLYDWSVGAATEGFLQLVERGHVELTAEYLVIKYADEFPEEAVKAAQERLDSLR